MTTINFLSYQTISYWKKRKGMQEARLFVFAKKVNYQVSERTWFQVWYTNDLYKRNMLYCLTNLLLFWKQSLLIDDLGDTQLIREQFAPCKLRIWYRNLNKKSAIMNELQKSLIPMGIAIQRTDISLDLIWLTQNLSKLKIDQSLPPTLCLYTVLEKDEYNHGMDRIQHIYNLKFLNVSLHVASSKCKNTVFRYQYAELSNTKCFKIISAKKQISSPEM